MKELELEAEKHKQEYSFFTKETQNQKKQSYIAGATTSKYVEKQKLEFAISILNRAKDLDIQTVYFELKQKLSEL